MVASKLEMKVRITKSKGRRTPNYRGIYLPFALYKLLGEPDVFVVEDIDFREKTILLRAVKKGEAKEDEVKKGEANEVEK